jgi:hypothetical protein
MQMTRSSPGRPILLLPNPHIARETGLLHDIMETLAALEG